MFQERRASAREPLALPIQLADGSPAITRDVSAQGLYFFVPSDVQLDPWLWLEYEMPQSGLKFMAAGEIVRTEAGRRFTGVAVRLHEPRLLPLYDD
jgi:hypothetical protein